jgi:hypothetical protein
VLLLLYCYSINKPFCSYIKTNNLQSAYALHILNHLHQYGPIEEIMEILRPARKSTRINCLESYYIQLYQQKGLLLIEEQSIGEVNPLYSTAQDIPT